MPPTNGVSGGRVERAMGGVGQLRRQQARIRTEQPSMTCTCSASNGQRLWRLPGVRCPPPTASLDIHWPSPLPASRPGPPCCVLLQSAAASFKPDYDAVRRSVEDLMESNEGKACLFRRRADPGYDRYLIRLEEMRESLRIIGQCLSKACLLRVPHVMRPLAGTPGCVPRQPAAGALALALPTLSRVSTPAAPRLTAALSSAHHRLRLRTQSTTTAATARCWCAWPGTPRGPTTATQTPAAATARPCGAQAGSVGVLLETRRPPLERCSGAAMP